MKRFLASAAMVLLILSLSIPAFSQGLNASVTGVVTDSSKALIPGVTIKATAVDTNVVSTTVTNEAGSYTFTLPPGKYTITASLPGFQTKSITDAQLSQSASSRYNFELGISGVNTQVEVSISADTILATQGATVGQALSQQKVRDLPLVGNNILDLITVMAGVENVVPSNPPSATNAFGRENTTFAGVRADNVMIVRDGIDMNDNRSPNGIYSITTINPDLVGEIRLILAPVDVEMGRGNGQIQYTTRSGTNKFTGAAVWSFRNTAFDPNSWSNNRNQTIPITAPQSVRDAAALGKAGLALQPNWSNTQQGTISFGGPIVKNKTFFFGLVDVYKNRNRSLDNFIVYTPCARLGIYRYFNTWNSLNALGTENTTLANRRAVDLSGNPIAPTAPAVTTANYDPSLQQRSIFGPLASMPAKNDCSDAPVSTSTLVPNGVSVSGTLGSNSGGWDPFRRQMDASGYISRWLSGTPLPNNYEVGDGLNTAGYRLLRHSTGLDNLFGSGEATGNRNQYNVKVDHNFNSNNKANVNATYERTASDDVFAPYPPALSNSNFRHPIVVTGGFTSTLSSTLLNEARVGYRLQDLNVVAPMALPEDQDFLTKLIPPYVNGIKVLPFTGFTNTTLYPTAANASAGGICPLFYGSRPSSTATAPGTAAGCSISPTSKGKTPTTTLSDTMSWTHGTHSFRFNGELRLNSSKTESPGTSDFTGSTTYAAATLGSNATGSTAPGTAGVNDFSSTNSRAATDPNNLKGLTTGSRTNAISLMNFMAGSLSNVAMQYYLNGPTSTTPSISDWKDYRNNEYISTTIVQREFSAWAKDEWKVKRNLTLTMGLRWDYTGVPYIKDGSTIGQVGGGAAAFGISGRDFTGWLNPGKRAEATTFEFVGPGSPNPDKSAYPNIYTNFGPSFAFSWTPSLFGEGKTTIRGGYQITYSTGSPQPGSGRFSSYSTALQGAPGRTTIGNANTAGTYLDLNPATLTPIVPVAPTVAPLQSQGTTGPRNAGMVAFDPNYASPYVQNITLSVTRSINRTFTMDLRYVGTLARKSYFTPNLNINGFVNNGLLAALQAVRTGDDANTGLLDKIFAGINLCASNTAPTAGNCGAGSWGPINGSTQRAATQIRANGLGGGSLTSLANGDVNTLAGTISNFNYNWGAAGNIHSCVVNCTLPDPNPNGSTVGSALRLNNFPDNFVVTNPQFSNVTYFTNWGYNNYHAFEAQVTIRPVHGFSGTATYQWSKNLGLLPALTDPTNRAQDYTNIGGNPGHEFRTNGTFELPLGPNKLLMGGSSGWLARAVERWQLGIIYNLSSGAPTSITATSMTYGNGLPDVRHYVDFDNLKGQTWNTQNGNFIEGRYFTQDAAFVKVPDPQCLNVTSQQSLSIVPASGALRCTLTALAIVVPAGTPDSGPATATYGAANINGVADTRNVQIVLQHPQSGQKGNLGNNVVQGLGTFRFDANLGKTFRVTESKSLQFRFDALNVLNHPQPAAPTLNIDSANPFGQIASKTGTRTMQGSLRFTF